MKLLIMWIRLLKAGENKNYKKLLDFYDYVLYYVHK